MAHILIVEDYLSIQNVYKSVLEKARHKIATATTGQEALDQIKKHDFDLILLDILLPTMDGISFLRSFDITKHPTTKILVTTNMDDPDLRRQATELGAADYLIKSSLTPDQLIITITNALGDDVTRR